MTAILLDMASQLGMEWASFETEEAYRSRLMTSAASAWLLSLTAGGNWFSMKDLSDTVTRKLNLLFEKDASATVNFVLKTLLENGFLLQKQEEITAGSARILRFGEVSLIRGGQLPKDSFFSGACAFARTDRGEKIAWTSYLDLPDPDTDYLSLLFSRGEPEKHSVSPMEYLTYDSAGFWMYDELRPEKADMLLGMTRDMLGNEQHYVIQGNRIRRIPDSLQVDDLQSYARLQVMRDHAPAMTVTSAKQLVRFSCPLSLPTPEMRFLRLVTWPDTSVREPTFSVHSQV